MKSTSTINGPPLRNPPPNLETIVADPRATVARVLADFDASEKATAHLEKNLGKWRGEFAELGHADSCDAAAMSRRAQLREQIEVGERQLAERQGVDNKPRLASCVRALRQVMQIVQPREHAAVLTAAIGAVEPYCDSRGTAQQVAESLPVVRAYADGMSRIEPYAVDKVVLARRALAALDSLAQGFWPWPTP